MDTDEARVTCPHCSGEGRSFVFVNNGPDYRTHTSGRIGCRTCKGRGAITKLHALKIDLGKKIRDQRVRAGRTLQEESRRLGFPVTVLSDIERGRHADISDVVRAMKQGRLFA